MKNRKKLNYLLVYLSDPKVSLIKKLWLLAPILYFFLPTDLVPDFLLGPGFIDDVVVILILFGKIQRDLDRYILKRNQSKNQTETGPVIENIEYKVHDD